MAMLAQLILFAGGLVFLAILPDVVWSREQIKKDLRRKGSSPIYVRWCPYPFGYWSRFGPGNHAFRVSFVDETGCIQTARCAARSLPRNVYWVSDEVRYLDAELPRLWRVVSLVAAILFAAFGLKHLITGTILWPGRFSGPFQSQGWSVRLLALALLCCAGNLLAEAFYHRQASERRWTGFARGAALLAWILFWAAIVTELCQGPYK